MPLPFQKQKHTSLQLYSQLLIALSKESPSFWTRKFLSISKFSKSILHLESNILWLNNCLNWWLLFALQSNSNWVENCWIVKEWTEAETHLQVTEAKVHILFIKNQLNAEAHLCTIIPGLFYFDCCNQNKQQWFKCYWYLLCISTVSFVTEIFVFIVYHLLFLYAFCLSKK